MPAKLLRLAESRAVCRPRGTGVLPEAVSISGSSDSMKSPAEHVRLACATVAATGSILFVTVYSFAKGVRFKGALAGLPLPNLTVWLVASEWYALFVPFCLLILGLARLPLLDLCFDFFRGVRMRFSSGLTRFTSQNSV